MTYSTKSLCQPVFGVVAFCWWRGPNRPCQPSCLCSEQPLSPDTGLTSRMGAAGLCSINVITSHGHTPATAPPAAGGEEGAGTSPSTKGHYEAGDKVGMLPPSSSSWWQGSASPVCVRLGTGVWWGFNLGFGSIRVPAGSFRCWRDNHQDGAPSLKCNGKIQDPTSRFGAESSCFGDGGGGGRLYYLNSSHSTQSCKYARGWPKPMVTAPSWSPDHSRNHCEPGGHRVGQRLTQQ